MRPSKARYVTACQQMLALAAVLAVLAPAASVISLDVVVQQPQAIGAGPAPAAPAAPAKAPATKQPADRDEDPGTSRVETGEVDPVVKEYDIEPADEPVRPDARPDAERPDTKQPDSAEKAPSEAVTTVSDEVPVKGYGAVGVTWSNDREVTDEDISLEVRTKDGGEWSDWSELEYHDEHGPDADSPEARKARPGTDALLVGDVDEVQVKTTTTEGKAPEDMKLAVIDPGKGAKTTIEEPAIDTSKLDTEKGAPASEVTGTPPGVGVQDPVGAPETDVTTEGAEEGAITLQKGTFTPKPVIYSRAQWGADERLRDKGSLRYYEVHAGFVHHTVNANNYTSAQVPGIIRSIYAYHTQSKGWSDIGYNFLVDRFGKIWEGRYGGVDRPVVGAHTLGYNDYAFAMSAIGNFETTQPPTVMLQAYGKLMAWKLSLHGIAAGDTSQRVGSKTFKAINGHRDAGQTACPGRYLYAKLATIRTLASQAQKGWSGRERETNLVSTSYPDIVVRRTSDKAAYAVATQGLLRFHAPRVAATGWNVKDIVIASPDLTGDGRPDLVARNRTTGTSAVHPGNGAGKFSGPTNSTGGFKGLDLLTAVGDLNGDGRNDLVARKPSNGTLHFYAGNGKGKFTRKQISASWGSYNLTTATGDLTGDGRADLVTRDKSGKLWLHPGTGKGALGARKAIAGSSWSGYETITGFGDYNKDGRNDLFVRNRASGNGFVIPSKGSGTFGHWLGPVTTTKGLTGISVGGNVYGTVAPDVVALRGSQLVVVPNAGTYDASRPVSLGVSFASVNLILNAGDWDRDGRGDLVTRNTKGTLELRRGLGANKFAAPKALGTGFGGVGLLSAVGDMTGDGWPDLMGQPSGAAMRIYPGRGLNGLRTSYVASGRIDGTRQIGIGRWDTDGAPDSLFRRGNGLVKYPGNGPGGFTSPSNLKASLSLYDWIIGVSDVNLTGHPDLIVREKATGYLWLLPGSATGVGARKFLAEGFKSYDLAG